MSSSDYLRTRLAALNKVVSITKPTDSSVYTAKKRMATSASGFFIDGSSIGTTRNNTDDTPTYGSVLHRVAAYQKTSTGKVPLSSDYTTYAGSAAAAYDIRAQNAGGQRLLLCVDPAQLPPTPYFNYVSGSDHTRALKCADNKNSVTDGPGAPLFVDNTIRLSAGVPSKVNGCCGPQIEKPVHTIKDTLLVGTNNQRYSVGKPFYVAENQQPANVAPKQGGGYLGPRTTYVERKHGYVQPTLPTPVAPGGQGQDKAVLRINDPTFFNKL
jgi:hypothetical protein